MVVIGASSDGERFRGERPGQAAEGLTNYDGPMMDAVVIGGGIAGLAAAWDLRNRDVVVLESTGCAAGDPQRAARSLLAEPRRARLQRPGIGDGRLVADVGVEASPVPGHLVALELNGRLLVGGRPELYPLRLPLPARSASR